MAPALTETAADGHRVRLSPPLASCGIDLDGAILGDGQKKSLEDSSCHTTWVTLTYLPSPSDHSGDPLDFQDSLLPRPVQPSGHYNSVLLSHPSSILSLLSLNKNLAATKNPLATCHRSPGVSIPEHNGQQVASSCRSLSSQSVGGGQESYETDVARTPLVRTDSLGESVLKPGMTPLSPTGVNGPELGACRGTPPARSCADPTQAIEHAVQARTVGCLSRHRTLVEKAGRIQRRLWALQAEQATHHCSVQLGDLTEGLLAEANRSEHPSPVDCQSLLPADVQSLARTGPLLSVHSADIQRFTRSARAVLMGKQEVLDSDATDSSSDEEVDQVPAPGTRTPPVCRGCERRWQSARAEIGSCWTWLQIRTAELEGRIHWLGDLHQKICAAKRGVVLAKSQPLADWTTHRGLSCTTAADWLADTHDPSSDPEAEPCSPTRLLRNIERQSAQLTQIVNSLMPPFNFYSPTSPVSQPACKWRGLNKTPLSSDLSQNCSPWLNQAGLKRRPACRGKQKRPRLDSTAVSARTRPLLSYHKPRLFALNLSCQSTQALESCSVCPSCSACDTLAVCTDPSCSSRPLGREERAGQTRPHPGMQRTSETTLPPREDWVLPPESAKAERSRLCSCSGVRDEEPSSSLWSRRGRAAENHGKRWRRGRGGSTAVRGAPATRKPVCGGGRKRRHPGRTAEGDGFSLSRHSDPSCYLSPSLKHSLSDNMTLHATLTDRQPSKSNSRPRLQGEGGYDIHDIVIPASLVAPARLEKLEYRDILTPSWRVVDIQPLQEKELDIEEAEALSDAAFSRRHRKWEGRERLRWTPRGRSRGQRRSIRASRRAGRSWDGALSVWDSAAPSDLIARADCGFSHPAEDSVQFLLPWQRRAFPLSGAEEEALRSDSESTEDCSVNGSDSSEHSTENSWLAFHPDGKAPSAGGTLNLQQKADFRG